MCEILIFGLTRDYLRKTYGEFKLNMYQDGTFFNAFDFLLLTVLVFSMMIGFFRGFVREIFGLSAWVGAVFLALQNYQWPKALFASWIHEPMLLSAATHLFVFCLFLIGFLFIAQWLSYYVQNSMAQSIDRSLGLIFGFIRGGFVICAVYLGSLFYVLPQAQPCIIKSSRSYVWIDKGAIFLTQFLPSALLTKDFLQKSLKELQQIQLTPEQLTETLSAPSAIPK